MSASNLRVISSAQAQSNLQFKFGDEVSIFAVKSYQSNKGNLFEAVGNVVIIHKDDTLYGESASIATDTGKFTIKGNVRYIAKDITIYGSKIDYDMKTGQLSIENARIATTKFYIVAKNIKKVASNRFIAQDAEYSTCRDCPESWTIYGNEIDLTLNEYVRITHALFKINTVNVMYIPYLVLPAKKDRESGLLFPRISTRLSEGISLEQPWFWAISANKDMTFTPTFWAKRGYGMDYEYRHIFKDQSWLQLNSRFVDDEIYLPGKLTDSDSGEKFFRYFSVFENHHQISNNYTHHLEFIDAKDMDIVRDHPNFTDKYVRGSEIGASLFFDLRNDYFDINLDSHFNHNLIYSESTEIDNSYVQVLPKLNIGMAPINLIHSNLKGFSNINIGLDTDYTFFRQNNVDEALYLRNANRLNVIPYLDWNLGSWGAFNLNSKMFLDFQHYSFKETKEQDFEKYAGRINTKFSFSLERIFGLSFEEKVKKTKSNNKVQKNDTFNSRLLQGVKTSNLIGQIDDFEKSSGEDFNLVSKYSYKHLQTYNFIHHYITDEKSSGNEKFYNQIQINDGWFDYVDAIRSRENLVGTNETRTIISPNNTLEFQWSNKLIRKSPRSFNYFDDQRDLRDNFIYNRIGYFDISQGYEFESDSDESSFTRLLVRGGYSAALWDFNFEEYYFHENGEHFFKVGALRNYDLIKIFADININTFNTSPLKTLNYGFHLRPSDMFGFTVNYEYDLENRATLRSLYAVDFIPSNNCWKMELGYRKTIVDNRFSFDWVLNFGAEKFTMPNTRVKRF
jgi:LPS-assembly protein